MKLVMKICKKGNRLLRISFRLIVFTFVPIGSPGQQSPHIGNLQVFPINNPWNWDISKYQIHPNSANYIVSIGENTSIHPDFGTVYGIPYIVVNNNQVKYPINYTLYADESDPGPFPIPLNAPIEGGSESTGDRHVISIDVDIKILYELYYAYPLQNSWDAGCGVKFDLTSNQMRPAGWTSADAAGLPVFPGLVRYEEVYIKQVINHALRFTVASTQKAYIWPARHYASSNSSANLPPMGLRLRLKNDFDISGFSDPVKVILVALKKYGMLVADNGSNWYITGAPDERWNDAILDELKSIHGSNFEAVKTVDENGDPIFPVSTSANEMSGNITINSVAFPNPFKASTNIKFYIDKSSLVKLSVINALGNEIITLIQEWLPEGYHLIEFNGQNLPGGIYYYNILAEKQKDVGKLVLLK
jgi:hypothetical protein